MKKSTLILVGFAVLFSSTTQAQHSSKAAESKPFATAAQKSSAKAVTLLGQVSADGKSFLSDDDDIWMVSNPSLLAEHQGHYISLRCQMNAGKNEIYVFSAKAAVREAKFVPKSGDSAFRR